jgi:DNA-directed RNA polymerase specialized sigma subunit
LARSKVEDILYSYSTLDRDIAELTQELKDMMPKFSTSIVIFNHNTGGDQSSKQEMFITSRRYEIASNKLERLLWQKIALDDIRKKLTCRELMIFELKYVRGLQHQYVARHIGIARQVYYRQKDRLLLKVYKGLQNLTEYDIMYTMGELHTGGNNANLPRL